MQQPDDSELRPHHMWPSEALCYDIVPAGTDLPTVQAAVLQHAPGIPLVKRVRQRHLGLFGAKYYSYQKTDQFCNPMCLRERNVAIFMLDFSHFSF